MKVIILAGGFGSRLAEETTLAALSLLIGGVLYFRRMEKTFADVV